MTTFIRPAEKYTVECPNNDGGKVVKIGMSGDKQRFRCKACLKEFRDPNIYSESNKYTTQIMGMALQGHVDGLSYRDVARNIGRTFKVEAPDEATVYRWVQEYGRAAFAAMNRQNPKVGDRWVADEIQLKVGGKRLWLWNVMDAKTRYILGIHLTPSRKKPAAAVVMRKAIEAAGKRPRIFVSDQLGSYIEPAKQLMPGTKHIGVEGLDAKVNNNLSERLQGSIRERTKVSRGFYSQKTGQEYLEAWITDYNLLRPHMGLGDRTPAEMAGIEVPFRSWGDIIEKLTNAHTPSRPDWHFREPPVAEMKMMMEPATEIGWKPPPPPRSGEPSLGKMLADKGFEKMDIAAALEAVYPLWKKQFKSVHDKKKRQNESEFRIRKGP